MNDDDLWAAILGSDNNSPSAPPFTGGLNGGFSAPSVPSWDDTGLPADIIATLPPPPQNMNTGITPLSSPDETGLPPSVIATLPPQRDDTSAAFLSPSSLASPPSLFDPDPELTVDQIAMMYGMTPEQIATIRGQAGTQAGVQIGAKTLLAPAAEYALPELGVPVWIARLAGLAIDTNNRLTEPSDEQYIQDAQDRAVFRHLNDSLAQPYESPNLPGLRSRFPFP